jgi:hypothetical protein
MKNSVYVIGATYTKTLTAGNTQDVYTTVAGTVVYPIAYPYGKSAITVTLDGVSQTVGIDQQTDPSTVQVLYNDSGHPFVKFTSDPSNGHTLKVFGKAIVPIIAHASDASSIATYGEYQDVITDKKITSVPEAQARAQASILQFGQPVYSVKVKTFAAGCALGQAITVNLPAFGLSKQLVIKRIEATVFAPGTNAQLEYQLECIGTDNVTFVDIMTTLLQLEASQNPVDDSTVNENLEVISEAITITEALVAPTAGTPPYHWGNVATQIKWGFWTWS